MVPIRKKTLGLEQSIIISMPLLASADSKSGKLSEASANDKKHLQKEAFDRSIDVHVCRLRQRLGEDAQHSQLIRTVRGAGYVLTAQVDTAL